ncbi:MAG: hypothetical protein ACXWCB_10165 [Acidimicrobiales bacterium]
MSSTQKAVAAAVAAIVLVVVVVVATRGSDGSSAATGTTLPATAGTAGSSGTTPTSASAADAAAPTTTAAATPDEGGSTSATNAEGNSIMVPVRNLPLDVRIDRKSGLADGDTVTVHVTAKSGSKIYGADARLCADGAAIENSADYAPTQGGQCIASPLSSSSDAFVEQAGADPYSSLDLRFRVGTGTSTYQVQDGSPVSITCGPGHPCTLVVRLQIPDGFGFQSFDLGFG